MRIRFLLSIFLVSILSISFAVDRKTYKGYQIFKVIPENEEQLRWLKDVQSQEKIDFLSEPSVENNPCYVLLSPEQRQVFEKSLKTHSIEFELSNPDVESDLKQLWSRIDQKEFDIDDFNDFNTIMDALDEFQSRCPNGATCGIRSIGNSIEGRLQKVFELTKGTNRKIIWIDSAIHAREWLSVSTVLKVLNTMIEQTDQAAIDLFDKYDFYFMPVLNPDGYQYTFTNDRFWRKNRRVNPGSSCLGIDLNRNYDSQWGTAGASTNPCSQTYMGSGAASEIETKNVQNEALRIGSRTLAWITTHTFGQMVLTPYSYLDNGLCYRSEDYEDLKQSADAFANGIEEVHQTSWSRGTFCEVLYPGSGTLVDYVKEKGNVKYSYTPELRGPGFNPSKDQIQPSYEEYWNGLKKLIAKIEEIEGSK